MAAQVSRSERVVVMVVVFFFALFPLSCAGRMGISRQRLEVQKHLKRLNKPAVKTIKSPDGDIIDCVHVSHQAAFDHPFLKNHTIQMRPSYHPEGLYGGNKISSNSITQLWHLNGRCPENTIPVRRTKREDVLRASSVKRYGRKKHSTIPKPRSADPDLINESGHQHAIAYVEGDKYYGAKATINVWEPKIQQSNEFSLSQLWILGGSFGQDLNSIEAGWQVSPDLYGDNNTRLFTYWTSDAYQATGCYNLLCSGFIQINSQIAMGASIYPVSGYHGSQYDISILVWKALRHIRQIAQETSGEIQYGGGRQPAVLRTFSQRMCKGFNDAVNGFVDDGWSLMCSDGVEDVTIAINSSPSKLLGSQGNSSNMLSTVGVGVLCAKASMLLQNVPPALLVRFLREHRSEWADSGVDAYSAASLKATPYAVPGAVPGGFPSSQVILPLAHTVEHEEFLEVIRLEGHGFSQDDAVFLPDMYLLQLCSGVDENAAGACAQLVFAPIDESFADDAPLLPSGFRVIPLDPKTDGPATTRTLDLASTLEVGPGGTRPVGETASNSYNLRSVLTIAFQFTYENHFRDSVAAMARQYVRSVVGSVQRVAMAIAPSSGLSPHMGSKLPPGSPEALTLARWICQSYRFHTGVELLRADSQAGDSLLKLLWHHSDAIMCCSLKANASPVFTFANQAGLDMLETTLVALQDIMLDKILDEAGRKMLCSEFPKIMQQGYSHLPAGISLSSMGRPVSYEQAIAWKVLNEENSNHCLAFMFMNWSFV